MTVNSRLESSPVKEKEKKEKEKEKEKEKKEKKEKEKEKEKRNLKNYEMDRFLPLKMEERKKLGTGSSFTLFGQAIPGSGGGGGTNVDSLEKRNSSILTRAGAGKETDSSSSMVLMRNRTHEVPGSGGGGGSNVDSLEKRNSSVLTRAGKENVLPVGASTIKGVGSAGGSLLALGSEVLNQPTWVNKGIAGEDVVELLQFSLLCLTNRKMGIFIQSPVGDAVSGKVLFFVGKTACEYFTALGKEFGDAWMRVAGLRTITSGNGEIDLGYSYYYR